MRGWLAIAALLAVGALIVAFGPRLWGTPADAAAWRAALDWQPGRTATEPWRAWTAALVHGSRTHLAGNLLATALVAGLGAQARVSARDALAWLVAWPLTQAALDAVAAIAPVDVATVLPHYFGLSGVLHAGVVVIGLSLARRDAARARERRVGFALLAGVVVKVLLESPWDLAPRPDALLGIGVAPIAHATGTLTGALAFLATRRRGSGRPHEPRGPRQQQQQQQQQQQ